MLNELLTVTMPVYERLDYFREALESARRQTVPVRIVVVDNASSHDGFRDIVESYGDERIAYVRNASNLGMYGNWNRCAELSPTPYFLILGDDDIMHPNYAECFLSAQQEHPSISAYFSQIEWFGDAYDGNTRPYELPSGHVYGLDLLRVASEKGLNIPTTAMVLARSLFASHQFLYPKYAFSQDWLFTYTALADQWCYSDTQRLLRYRAHAKGNALAVGSRAVLSTSLVYHEIASRLSAVEDWRFAARAAWRERWVPRNAAIRGEAALVRGMMDDLESPFGHHLRGQALTDGWLRLALKKGRAGQAGVLILRVQRFFSRRPLVRDFCGMLLVRRARQKQIDRG
jgi:glycosyltransferase involved in cell wall biosynthesis